MYSGIPAGNTKRRGEHGGCRPVDARRTVQMNYLDAIAQNLYKGNAEQLRAWTSASHVERDPSHAAVMPTPAPAGTATTTTK